MKLIKKLIFYTLIGISVLGIPVFAYGILNTMVSLKYETDNPTDCISLVTGQDLCFTIQVLKASTVACIGTLLILIIFKKQFLTVS